MCSPLLVKWITNSKLKRESKETEVVKSAVLKLSKTRWAQKSLRALGLNVGAEADDVTAGVVVADEVDPVGTVAREGN